MSVIVRLLPSRHLRPLTHIITSPSRLFKTARQFHNHGADNNHQLTNQHISYNNNHVVPAIIIGSGPTGLLLSNLLTCHSIPHLLFDKRSASEIMKHPQAHFINLRSMEILKSTLPNVYASILEEQPARTEWEAFHFGGCVSSGGGMRLGRVIHPVHEGLRVGQRGDALLSLDPLANQLDDVTNNSENAISSKDRVSPCQPAHLAQNKFISLLLCKAQQYDEGKHLFFDEEIIDIQASSTSYSGGNGTNEPVITIHTSKGQSYQTRFLLACDGVHSFARRYCNIEMRGESALQHMMNVHFRTNESLSKLLMRRTNSSRNKTSGSDNHENSKPDTHDQAMLHFVYNPHLVGAFVCHDGCAGEWVLQIPYFPPYQSPEVDFSHEKVKEMIWYGLLGRNHNRLSTIDVTSHSKERHDLDILSIRSWTMSSLVAERYMNKSQSVILVGDAAHAFPPAGGFGMNTGLQDAHNLAWRLALVLHREERMRDRCTPQPQCNSILPMYEQDRKHVASQNAALSVRNYQRTLQIAKACYLDAQHPQLLMTMLDSPPMSFLPLEARQEMFRRLVNLAMLPLASLLDEKDSIHSSHVEKNVKRILESGGSLPLVFPRYEIGFHYNPEHNQDTHSSDDTAGYDPKIRVGHRLPHFDVKAVSNCPSNTGWSVFEASHQVLSSSTNSTCDAGVQISLVDISSQLKRVYSLSAPLFTLLALGSSLISSSSVIQTVATGSMNKWDVPLVLINVLREESDWKGNFRLSPVDSAISVGKYDSCRVEHCVDVHQALYKLASNELLSSSGSDSDLNALIMVRPDGYVANTLLIDQASSHIELEAQVTSFIEGGLSNCLGQTVS